MDQTFVNVKGPPEEGPYPCPCCGYVTLTERSMHEICGVCWWQDDGQGDHDADQDRGGPNHPLTLTQARRHFASFGASARRLEHLARPPRDDEHPLARPPW